MFNTKKKKKNVSKSNMYIKYKKDPDYKGKHKLDQFRTSIPKRVTVKMNYQELIKPQSLTKLDHVSDTKSKSILFLKT